jgi:hypothetical protein
VRRLSIRTIGRSGIAGLLALVLVAGVAIVASAHGGDANRIHSCVKSAAPGKGAVYIIAPNETCASGFTPTDWSITGPAGLVWRGSWNSQATYVKTDAVEFQGSAYVAIAASKNVPPPAPDKWNLLAQKGATGSQGPQGPSGPAGAQGPGR